MFLTDQLVIGQTLLKHRLLLAPMSGITDLPFRELCVASGAHYVCSEMIASAEFCQNKIESTMRSQMVEGAYNAIQLLGREPNIMAQAAIMAQDLGADIIDINMGCPAKKIISGQCGAALLKDVELACSIIEAVRKAVHIDLSIKIRLGWDDCDGSSIKIARFAEQCGVAMITIHARTRNQFYKGSAQWDKASKVIEAVDIPAIINGDIIDAQTARQAVDQSSASGVMIGRACYGAPWQIGQIIADLEGRCVCLKPKDLALYIKSHFEKMIEYYGEYAGILNMRKHYINYYKENSINADSSRLGMLLKSTNSQEIANLVDEIFKI